MLTPFSSCDAWQRAAFDSTHLPFKDAILLIMYIQALIQFKQVS